MPDKGKHARQADGGAVPQITNADLHAFHQAHFSDEAVQKFRREFLASHATHIAEYAAAGDGYEYQEDNEDDGLGFYHDGVKRTLTDEQIAIFRHSEIQALRREQNSQCQDSPSAQVITSRNDEGEEGSTYVDKNIDSEALRLRPPVQERQKKRGDKHKRQEPKPDLRKRTWDVVEAGIDTLDYD